MQPVKIVYTVEGTADDTTGATGVDISSGGSQVIVSNLSLTEILRFKLANQANTTTAANNTDHKRVSVGPGQSGSFSRHFGQDRIYLYSTATGAAYMVAVGEGM